MAATARAVASAQAFKRAPTVVWLEDGIDPDLEKQIATKPKAHIELKGLAELTRMIGGKSENAETLSTAVKGYASAKEELWREWEADLPGRRLREERDRKWAGRILGAARERSGWGVALIGAAHATRYDRDMLRSILDRSSVHVSRRFLETPPLLSRTG